MRRARPPVALAVVALLVVPGSGHAARKPTCDVKRTTTVETSNSIRVYETRKRSLYACWKPTGRKVWLGREYGDFDDGESLYYAVTIAHDRFVGSEGYTSGASVERMSATVYDAKRGKELWGETDLVFEGPFELLVAGNGGALAAETPLRAGDLVPFYAWTASGKSALPPVDMQGRDFAVGRSTAYWTDETGTPRSASLR